MRKRKFFRRSLCVLLCGVFFVAGVLLEWGTQIPVRQDIARLVVATELKSCITDAEVDLYRMWAFLDLNSGRLAQQQAEECERFLDDYGPFEPDENKSQVFGEMKLFVHSYKEHIQEMVARQVKIMVADTRLSLMPTLENMQVLVELEEEQLEGFRECLRFTDKLQTLVEEAME